MSEPEVKSILTRWGMDELIETFEDNEIDLESFKLLDETSLKELIPKVGLRVKFAYRLKSYVDSNTTSNDCNAAFYVKPSSEDDITIEMGPPSTSMPDGTKVPHSPGSRTTDPVSSEESPSGESSSSASSDGFQPRIYFDVINILKLSARGQSVITSIRKDGLLTPSNRRILVASCVAELVLRFGHKPSSFQKESLAKAVVVAFPCLKDSRGRGHEAFYTKGTSGRPASGWLEEHLKYSRKRVKKYSTTEEATSPEGKHDTDEDTADSVSEEDTQKMKTWLQHNEQPRATMEEYMLKTAKRRQRLIKSRGFKEALVEYPKILLPGMIEQDFQVLQPDAAEKLYEKWPAVCPVILSYTEKNFPGWMKELPWDCKLLTEEELGFFALPYIFQSRHKRKKGRGSMSVSAGVKAFIDIRSNVTNIKSFCGDIDETVHPQPFTVVLWDLKQKSRQFFVLIERKPLPATSLLKAIDTCFKMHFVFDIEYQPDCEASWQFLQSIIYELNTAITKEISSVKAFRAYYNSM